MTPERDAQSRVLATTPWTFIPSLAGSAAACHRTDDRVDLPAIAECWTYELRTRRSSPHYEFTHSLCSKLYHIYISKLRYVRCSLFVPIGTVIERSHTGPSIERCISEGASVASTRTIRTLDFLVSVLQRIPWVGSRIDSLLIDSCYSLIYILRSSLPRYLTHDPEMLWGLPYLLRRHMY